ncbi:MAG: GNAT family N-acetyltransferase [Ruthenibacterium sp.]
MKLLYDQFVTQTYVPIFSQPWWLDAACGAENWDVFVVEQSGTLLAAMPYFIQEKDGIRKITKAPNTQNNGILFHYPAGQKYPARLAFEEKMINRVCDFIESLPIDQYEQQFHYSFTNWMPFFWRRYSEITRYTYVIENPSDYEDVIKNYTSQVRNQLRKAEKTVRCEELSDIALFFKVNEMSFLRQGRAIPYSLNFVQRIYDACKARDACKMLAAVDGEGHVHSVAFLVWDDASVYYLLNGTNPAYKASQANLFLIDQSIRIAGELGKKFDFEGSVILPIAHAFRDFGGIQTPYFRISKTFHNAPAESLPLL